MLDEASVVTVTTSVKLVPDASQYGCSSESKVLYLLDILRINTSQGNHFLVNDACLMCFTNFFTGIVAEEILFGLICEGRAEKQIVMTFFVRLDFFQCMTRTAKMSFVLSRYVRISLTQMDSLQFVFVFQIEMTMNDDAFVILFGD